MYKDYFKTYNVVSAVADYVAKVKTGASLFKDLEHNHKKRRSFESAVSAFCTTDLPKKVVWMFGRSAALIIGGTYPCNGMVDGRNDKQFKGFVLHILKDAGYEDSTEGLIQFVSDAVESGVAVVGNKMDTTVGIVRQRLEDPSGILAHNAKSMVYYRRRLKALHTVTSLYSPEFSPVSSWSKSSSDKEDVVLIRKKHSIIEMSCLTCFDSFSTVGLYLEAGIVETGMEYRTFVDVINHIKHGTMVGMSLLALRVHKMYLGLFMTIEQHMAKACSAVEALNYAADDDDDDVADFLEYFYRAKAFEWYLKDPVLTVELWREELKRDNKRLNVDTVIHDLVSCMKYDPHPIEFYLEGKE